MIKMFKGVWGTFSTGQKVAYVTGNVLSIGMFVTFVVSLFVSMTWWVWLLAWIGSTIAAGVINWMIWRKNKDKIQTVFESLSATADETERTTFAAGSPA